MDEQRAWPIGIDEQVLPVPTRRGDRRADQRAELRARRLAMHVQALAAVPRGSDRGAERRRERAANGLDLGQLGHAPGLPQISCWCLPRRSVSENLAPEPTTYSRYVLLRNCPLAASDTEIFMCPPRG